MGAQCMGSLPFSGGLWKQMNVVVRLVHEGAPEGYDAKADASRGGSPRVQNYKYAQIVKDACSLIIQNYVASIDFHSLLARGLQGMQGLLGRDALSVTAEPTGFVLSSQGKSFVVNDASEKDKEAQEMAKAYSFAVMTNPWADELALSRAAINGMIGLDERSSYLSAEDLEKAKKESSGKVMGVGIILEKKDGRIIVLSCADQSPAHRAGVLPNDEVIAIDGKPVASLPLWGVGSLLRTPEPTEITLTLKRESLSSNLTVKMTTDVVTSKNLRHALLDGHYAYVHILRFGTKTAVEFDRALAEEEQASNREIKGIVLDLRNSAGGLFSEVVDTASHFFDDGLVVSLEGRQSSTKYPVKNRAHSTTCPMIVLVNSLTSAGSEIVAGVLQDRGRALVLGAPTAGGGSIIQTIFPLADGSAIRLTTNKCHLPSGRLIEEGGIIPDYDIGSRESALGVFKDEDRDLATRIAVQILKHAGTGSKADLQRAAQVCARSESGSPQPPASLKEAGAAFDRGDYEEAFRLLVPQAQAGDMSAQSTLGAMYLTGLGVTKDESKAAYWSRKAAEGGNAKAQANLGLIYLHGRGVPQDDAQAADWLRKAASQGNASAQSSLGVLFLEGRGVKKDYSVAKVLFSSAIKGGEVGAANNLARMVEQGLGQPPDVKAALGLYEIAAKFGDPAAQNRVGLACMNGEFRDRDMRAARDWFVKSASQGDKYGQYHLGMLLLDERPADTLPALQWISLSARQGYERAQEELGARVKALDDPKKAALRRLVDSWRPTGRGAIDPGVR